MTNFGIMLRLITVGMPTFLTACGTSWFAEPKTNPVIEDRLGIFNSGPVATLATTPERRIVLVNVDDRATNTRYGQFCAEPPSDVAESVAGTFQAALKAEANIQSKKTGKIDSNLSQSIATAIQQLGQRSQGIMLLRDNGYRLCEMYLNGAIGPEEYFSEMHLLRTDVKSLIEAELALTKGRIGAFQAVSLQAPNIQKQETNKPDSNDNINRD